MSSKLNDFNIFVCLFFLQYFLDIFSLCLLAYNLGKSSRVESSIRENSSTAKTI